MRLNGLGAPDEVTLVPLNKIEPAQTKPETKQAETTTQNTKKETASIIANSDITRLNAGRCKETIAYKPRKTTDKLIIVQARCLNVTPAVNPTKRKIVGMEPTLPTIRDLSVITHRNERWILPPNKQQLNLHMNQKTKYAAPALRGNSRREGVFTRRSPYSIRYRHNKGLQWYTDERLAKTTGPRLHKKTTPSNRKGRNLRPRRRV